MDAADQGGQAHPTTKQRIIDAAERLFADNGIDGVSLRQVAQAAQQLNHAAIQYHFGTKAGLVAAILDDRFARLELRRAILLQGLAASGALGDQRALMRAMVLPHVELVDATGRHTFAKFVIEFLIRYSNAEGVEHPFVHDRERRSAALKIWTLLRTTVPQIDERLFTFRASNLFSMFDTMLVLRDVYRGAARSQAGTVRAIEQMLDMMVAALNAPASSS